MAKNVAKTYSLDEVMDKYVGKLGTPKRDAFELELKLDLLGEAIKKNRKKRNLTQQQLGELMGVGKEQISKIENSTKDMKISTVLKAFTALKAKVKFHVELEEFETDLSTT